MIAPHAGYSYSGPTAGHAYARLREAAPQINRVFILGPSHHVYLRGCVVSGATVCQTPIENLRVDTVVCDELLATGNFESMNPSMDEDEHSIELHLPYIAKAMQGLGDYTIVPIMVGNLTEDSQGLYGTLLAPYLDDPQNFFVVSSDFCHWGSRFRYQPFDKTSYGQNLAIWEYIDRLDHEGMGCIEEMDPRKFSQYLARTENTICGRYPISVLLHMLTNSRTPRTIQFLAYKQSSKVQGKNDSSVSYASATVWDRSRS